MSFMRNISQLGPGALEKKLSECFSTYGQNGHLEFRIITILTNFGITTI